MPCDLCSGVGGQQVFAHEQLRVVLVDDPDYPGFTRVVWNQHIKEMTDISEKDRVFLMRTVFLVEQVQRDVLAPDKINLASLGNMTPHLHWHVIPRWVGDAKFPQPIWAKAEPAQSASLHLATHAPIKKVPVIDLHGYMVRLQSKLMDMRL